MSHKYDFLKEIPTKETSSKASKETPSKPAKRSPSKITPNNPTPSKTSKESSRKFFHHNPQIVEAASEIFQKFQSHREVVAISEMQAGKTDLMKRMIYTINNYNSQLRNINIAIDRNNIYVVLCASSI